jgi:hypothetical protein
MKKGKGSVLLFKDFSSLKFAELEADEGGYKPIPIFREGNFEHQWYGKLEFDREYLDTIVRNHENRAMPADISFDQSHNPDLGALAWVKSGKGGLFVEDVTYKNSIGATVTSPFLFAMIKLTPSGQQKIDDEEFRYFSSEINPDYSTREVVKLSEGETGIVSHGPVLVGGGFTNRPFIPNLGTAFSTDGKPLESGDGDITLTRNDDETFFFSDAVQVKPAKRVAEPVPVELQDDVPDITIDEPEPNGESRMKFSELIAQMKQFSTPAEKVTYLEGVLPELDETNSALAETLLETQREAKQFSQIASEATHKATLADKQAKQANEKVISLSQDLMSAKEAGYQEKVNAFSADLRANGHSETVVKVVEELLSGVEPSNRDMSFSSATAEAPALDVFGAIGKIFSALPAGAAIEQPAALDNDDDVVETKPVAAQEFNDASPEPTETETAEADELALRVQKYTDRRGKAPHAKYLNYLTETGAIDMEKFDAQSTQ